MKYFNLVVGSLEDHKQATAFDLVFETNWTRIVESRRQRRFKGVYFGTFNKSRFARMYKYTNYKT